MTVIFLPGEPRSDCGFADYGRKSKDEMLKVIRASAARHREIARKLDEAADHEFQIEVQRGIYVPETIDVIQTSIRNN